MQPFVVSFLLNLLFCIQRLVTKDREIKWKVELEGSTGTRKRGREDEI